MGGALQKLGSMMLDQNLINILMAGFGAAVTFILRVIWEGLRELQKGELRMISRLNEVEVLVAGQYAKKDDLDRIVERLRDPIMIRLDRIESKVDNKVDKPWSGPAW